MNTINKITEGNAFALNIRQAVWRTLGGVIQPLLASELVDVHLYVGSGTSKSTATEYNVTADGDTISAVMPATLKRGVYRTWMTALYQGREVASACECAFEIVAFDEHGIYAPERIDGQPCVYLQGASMTDPEIEQYKARLLELQQQREQEVQALEAERKRVAEVAAQMEDVATEKTQQLMVKHISTIAESTDISGLMNIKAAIELKGGQDMYSNPELPKLTELARNVGTIPQEFLKYTPDGVRYDDPVEWHVFNQDVAYAVEAARAFQNRIYAEGGIQSILHPDVKYKGFILFEYTTDMLSYDSTRNTSYIQLSYDYADAYLLAYEAADKCLLEKNPDDASKIYLDINMEGVARYKHFYIFYLYKEDDYVANINSISGNTYRFFNIVVGGHPSSVTMSNIGEIRGAFIQLNVTEMTNFRLWDNISPRMYYLRNKRGNLLLNSSLRIYLEQYEENDGSFVSGTTNYLYAPKLRMCVYNTEVSLNNVLYAELGLEEGMVRPQNCLHLSLPNFRKSTGIRAFGAKNNGPHQLVILEAPNYEEHYDEFGSNSNNCNIVGGTRNLRRLYLPKFRKTTAKDYHTISNGNLALEEIDFPIFEEFTSSWHNEIAYNCPKLERVLMPKLHTMTCIGHGYRANMENCPMIKKLIIGNVNSNVVWGCIGALDFIHFEFSETLDYTIRMENWRPTNALNDSISTLVEEGEEFTNNREKFLWNFRNYIIAMLYDHMPDGVSDDQTRSITLHKSVVDVLTEEDKAAITNKGWNLLVTT